jgi:fatty-acyl-CoA synthase
MSQEYQLTLDKLLAQTDHRRSKAEIVYQKTRYNWTEFHTRIRRLASGLEAMGVKKGSKVAVVDFDTHRYLEAYFAVPMMGAVLHTVNVRLPSGHIAYTMVHAGDEYILLRDEFILLATKIASSAKSIKGIVTMSDSGSAPSLPMMNLKFYDDLLAEGDPSYVFPELQENTMATIFYTSGTTGMPKGVWFTHRQLVLHTLAVQIGLGEGAPGHRLDNRDVILPLVPFFHVHSWGIPYIAGLNGQKIVLAGRYAAAQVLDLVSKEGVTFSQMVPSVLNLIVSEAERRGPTESLSKWKVVVGGAALSKELAVRARKLGISVMSGYGLSETGPVLTLANPTENSASCSEDELLDSVFSRTGIPIPLVQLRVVDEKMIDVPRDNKTIGEIVARGPWLAEEYYKDDSKTKELWRGGWLHTGDMAVMDSEGCVLIVDRIRDAIKSGGEWIPAVVLEELLLKHPAVSEAAVLGVKDQKWGERPIAVVSLREGQETTEASLRKHMEKYLEEGKIAEFWVPERFAIWAGPLPRTGAGKMDKSALRERYASLLVKA